MGMAVTELEQAKEHLLGAQETLRGYRSEHQNLNPQARKNNLEWIKFAERNVIAALSWVWDAQERAEPQLFVAEIDPPVADFKSTWDNIPRAMQFNLLRGGSAGVYALERELPEINVNDDVKLICVRETNNGLGGLGWMSQYIGQHFFVRGKEENLYRIANRHIEFWVSRKMIEPVMELAE